MTQGNSPLQLLCSAVTALAVSLSAYTALAIRRTLKDPIRPRLQLQHDDDGSNAVQPTKISKLDSGKLARAMGLRIASRTDSDEIYVPKKPKAAPIRSTLRLVLVGTAITEPERYSLCELRSTETSRTSVYGIGDMLMDWRIYAIAQDRVLIEKEGQIEYVGVGPSGSPPIVNVDKYSSEVAPYLGESDPPTPHG